VRPVHAAADAGHRVEGTVAIVGETPGAKQLHAAHHVDADAQHAIAVVAAVERRAHPGHRDPLDVHIVENLVEGEVGQGAQDVGFDCQRHDRFNEPRPRG
jgi:hypothetical protein